MSTLDLSALDDLLASPDVEKPKTASPRKPMGKKALTYHEQLNYDLKHSTVVGVLKTKVVWSCKCERKIEFVTDIRARMKRGDGQLFYVDYGNHLELLDLEGIEVKYRIDSSPDSKECVYCSKELRDRDEL